jgi:iron complex outermembrane receptor protein
LKQASRLLEREEFMILNIRRNSKSSLAMKLLVGSALSTLAAASAHAQGTAAETVVVTGTSIHGAAPIGSSLQTVGLDAIQDTKAPTLQSLLSDLPEMGNFGTAAVGNQNNDRGGGFSPTIHNIGAGSSIATLTLINGHRIPTTGLTESNSDPTIIASSALQRVDILPDGASATYGSDAVAGVANFITRQNFRGLEMNVQDGIADSYSTFNGSILFGNSWETGNVMVAYDYSSKSELANRNRDFVTARQDIRRGALTDTSQFVGIGSVPAAALTVTPAAGPGTSGPYGVTVPYPSDGQNFQTFACPVATIAPNNSSANAFYYLNGGYGPQGPTGTGYVVTTTNTNGNGACDNVAYGNLIPSETRNNAFIQVKQEITEDISIESTFSASTRESTQQLSRGTIQATVFGPGAPAANTTQINPFFVGNATTGNASELIRYDFNALLGPGAYDKATVHDAFTTQDITWDLGNGREITLGGVAGININQEKQTGVVGASGGQPLSSGVGQALLALNGSTSASGTISNSISDPLGLGSVYPGSRVLTTLNALDVWDPAGPTNKTSATVIRSLKDSQASQTSDQAIQDVKGQFDGPVFDLPAGSVKVAVGGEFLHQTMAEFGSNATSSGTASTTSQVFSYNTGRTVYSAYAEVSVPVISEEMGVPLMQSFSLDFAGRYDKYSDFGDTENPKVSFDWQLINGLKLRGSYGTSFVAPGIHDALGTNSQSIITAASFPQTNNTILFNVPNTYNGGAGTAGTWVADPANCAAGGGTVVNASGTAVTGPAFAGAVGCQVKFGATSSAGTSAAFQIAGGHLGLLPAHGRSLNLGFDLDGGKLIGLDGLVANVTWWQFTYLGLVTGGAAVHPSLTYFAPPGGWTATSPYMQSFLANRSLSLSVPAQIWGTVDNRLNNSFDIWMNGIDYTVSYNYATDDLGTFKFSTRGTELLRMSQSPHVIGGVTAEAAVVDVKDGKNSPRYGNAAPEWQFRATAGWQGDNLGVTFGFNYIHPQDGTDSSFPYSLNAPTTGGRGYTLPNGTFLGANQTHIGALEVFDLLINYDMPQGFLGLPDKLSDGTQLSMKIDNLLDTNPPFNPNSSSGFSIGNPVGRMFTIGVRKKF